MLFTILFILLVLLNIFQIILYLDIRKKYFDIKEVFNKYIDANKNNFKDIIDKVNDDCEILFDTVL